MIRLYKYFFPFYLIVSISFSQKHFSKKHFSQPFYNTFFVGFSLFDAQDQKFIYQYNADKYFTPASNTKIFTLYAFYNKRNDSIASLKYKFEKDTLYITGTGDPTFLNPKLNNTEVRRFLKNQDNPIVLYYQSLNQNYKNGWSIDDYFQGFSAEISSLPMYGNIISIKNNITTPSYFSPYTTFNNIEEQRSLNKNIFTYKENTELAFITSDTLTQKLLEKEIGKKIFLTKLNPFTNKNNIKLVKTLTYEVILKEMMKKSNNFFAEQLYILNCNNNELNSCNNQAKRDSILNNLFGQNLMARWEDGSGASRYNLFSPNQIITVLKKMYKENNFTLLKDYFAINGQYGTLENVFSSEKPFLYAKTGGLSNNATLSGYIITDSGKILIFSYMNNHFMNKNSEVKNKMYNLIKLIKEKY